MSDDTKKVEQMEVEFIAVERDRYRRVLAMLVTALAPTMPLTAEAIRKVLADTPDLRNVQ